MFYILLYKNGALIMILLGIVTPILFSTLIFDTLSALPKPLKKLLCFSPCIALVAISIKILVEGTMGFGFLFLMLPLLCISLYGGFAMVEILFTKKKR